MFFIALFTTAKIWKQPKCPLTDEWRTNCGIIVCVCVCVLSCFSCARLFAALWTIAHQAPLSAGFSRQESWSGLPCPPAVDLPDPRIEPASPALQMDSKEAQGAHPWSFIFSRSGVGLENLHFKQVSRWCHCCSTSGPHVKSQLPIIFFMVQLKLSDG